MTTLDDDVRLTAEVTDLLRDLIRNACVNDGAMESGQEGRNADLLRTVIEGPGLDLQTFEPVAGRRSLVARMEGTEAGAPSLLLMGHTDVVPANPEGWREDPFGGELIDGWVWGRGAVDMLNLTAAMAVVFRRLAETGFRPRGDLMYAAVADEEAMGTHGAAWLVEHAADAVRADFVVTEVGGFRLPFPGSPIPVSVAEKGVYWCRLRVHGTPGHASMPLRTDNALVKAAEVVVRLAEARPETHVHDVWRRFVGGLGLPAEMAESLLDPERVWSVAESVDDVGLARTVHASTHLTIAPTILHGGVKTNVIPDSVELQVDARTLPGQSGADARAEIEAIIGPELMASVEIEADNDDASTESPMDTPLWDSLSRVTQRLLPEARPVPFLIVGATDARFFRRLGSVAYGAGLFSDRIPFAQFESMFHGDDERVDQESLRLTARLFEGLAVDLLG